MGRGARTLSRDCRFDVIYKEKDDKDEVEEEKDRQTERKREKVQHEAGYRGISEKIVMPSST